MSIPLIDFDVFYISYDEPNFEENWSDLYSKVDWAQHVHGVKGFDAAHKRCAELSETDWFITVDGDNKVKPNFENEFFTLPENEQTVISFNSTNFVHGLCYGNGGVKIWPKEMTLKMNTHENADGKEEGSVEFCWAIPYRHDRRTMSTTYHNGSAFQAFRSGFREGVKLCMPGGTLIDRSELRSHVPRENMRRLLIWMTIGEDVMYGDWSIFGARLGCYLVNCDSNFDYNMIRDYDAFDALWKEWRDKIVAYENDLLMDKLNIELGLSLVKFDAHQSDLFKRVNIDPNQALEYAKHC